MSDKVDDTAISLARNFGKEVAIRVALDYFNGEQLVAIGILGAYVARIFEQVKHYDEVSFYIFFHLLYFYTTKFVLWK